VKTNSCNINCNTGCGEDMCPSPCSQGINRRDFLKMALATGLMAGCSPLAGCCSAPQPTTSTSAPTAVPTTPPTPVPTTVPTTVPSATPRTQTLYWPTESWPTSTPEAQGIDSEQLVRLLKHAEQNINSLHSLLIARNGHIVTEAYFYPFERDIKHVSFCASKTVLSTVVGAAIAKGLIESVDQSVLDLFADRTAANRDAYKEALTVEHLITSRAGIDWSQNIYYGEFAESDDQIQFVLDQPVTQEPGSPYASGGGGLYMASAILQELAPEGASAFAQTNFFDPLGISDALWETEASGLFKPFELYLKAHDLAKVGYLYLNDGVWDGQQILPAGWVTASVTEYSRTNCDMGMGYFWWLPRDMNVYSTRGWARLFVAPEQGMVIVLTTGALSRSVIDALAEGFMGAAISSEPLPENPEMAAQLDSWVNAVGQPPEPEPVPPLPELAQLVSGKTYALEDNPHDWQSFALSFQDQEAQVAFASSDGVETLAIGLDGVYCIGQASSLESLPTAATGESFALVGSWEMDKSFHLNLQLLSGAHQEIDFTFEEDGTAAKVGCPGLRNEQLSIQGTLQS
jgi:CubicO group peptidase (beta-lactamase class C family)